MTCSGSSNIYWPCFWNSTVPSEITQILLLGAQLATVVMQASSIIKWDIGWILLNGCVLELGGISTTITRKQLRVVMLPFPLPYCVVFLIKANGRKHKHEVSKRSPASG